MIDFACKSFKLEEVIKCGLGLSRADCKLMQFLIEYDEHEFTTEELAKKLGFNLSTVQRSVKKLHEKEVIYRKQENLSGGGYIFLYKSKEKKVIRKIIMDVVEGWVKKVKAEFDRW